MSGQKSTQITELLAEYETLWNGNVSELDIVAESITFSDPLNPEWTHTGRNALKIYLEALHGELTCLRVTNVDMLVDDESVLLERTLRYSSSGESPETVTQQQSVHHIMSEISVMDGKIEADEILWTKRSTDE